MQKYIKDTGFTFMAQFVGTAISFITSIVVARFFGPVGKGIVTIASLFPFIIAMIIALGIDEASIYFIGKNKSDHNSIFSNFLFVGLVTSSISILLLYLLQKPILTHFLKNLDYSYFLIIIFSIPFFLLLRYAGALFQGHHDFVNFNLLFILKLVLNLVFTIVLIVKFGILGTIIAMAISTGITSIIGISKLVKYGKPKSPDFKLLKRSLSYGLKAQPGVVLDFFNKRLDMFVVNLFAGATAVGYYSVAVAFAELLTKLPEAFGITLFPKIAQLSDIEGNKLTSSILRNIFFVMFAGIVLFALTAKPMIFITFGNKFYPAIVPLLILLPGTLFMGITKVICSNFQGQGKPEYGTCLTIVSVAFTIALDILLIPKYKAIGASIASTVSYCIASIISIILFKKRSGINTRRIFFVK